MNIETVKLFNAIQVESKKKATDLMVEKTIKHGFILSPEAASVVNDVVIKEISEAVGLSGEKANSAFHKTWKTVRDTPIETLVIQQILHYITTYGFEALGIFDENTVYIPNEKLKIPKVKDGIRLVVIRGLTKKEILEEIKTLGSGIALKKETLNDIMSIIEHNDYSSRSIIGKVSNKELTSLLYDYYDLVPDKPVEFLRFVVSRITGESLLIKNRDLIRKITEADTKLHQRTLDKALKQAPDNLAEIFFRFKPIFLALKKLSKNKTFFNRLRKQAEFQHSPMSEDYLNSVTAKLKNNKRIYLKELRAELDKVNIYRKIRLANALSYRLQDTDSIVYRVRNGKGYASDFNFSPKKQKTQRILDVVVKSIADSLDVKNKTFYIPEFVNYAVPATEKQFTGHFPTGSYITVPDNMIIGIHWFNTPNKRVDLDLALVGLKGKVGWDGAYRDDDVLFSGDLTSAPRPKGASELFLIKKQIKEDKIMTVNYFNYWKDDEDEVEASIVVAHDKPKKSFSRGYLLNPNKVLGNAKINITRKQNVLGLVTCVDNENRFYFANVNIGNTISSYRNDSMIKTEKYFVNMVKSSLDLKSLLEKAGAKIVTEKPEKDEFIDLSPEAINKTTFINLLNN